MVVVSQRRNILFSVLWILVLILIGTLGYLYFEKNDILEGLYFTACTITSVGYGDVVPTSPESRMFYTLLMLVGVVSLFYLGASIVGFVVEDRIINFLRRRFGKRIRKMKDHVIICGYGDVGSLVASGLSKKEVVIVERDEANYNELTEKGYVGVKGDSTQIETLKKANTEKARAIVIALNSDPDAIYTILTAKELNPDIEIYARANERGSLNKMERAGANYVICLPSVGSREILKAMQVKKEETKE